MIISLSGRKSSGKTTLAQECVKKGYILINFGDQLKDLICKMLNITFEFLSENKENTIELDLRDYKEFLCKEISISDYYNFLFDKNIKSYRELLQYLGTDIIRTINPDWHIKKVDTYLKANNLINKNLVFADTRFKNELEYIKTLKDNVCWYILSPYNLKNISNHISETELNWQHFENILENRKNKDTIDLWNKYLDTGNKSYLEINYTKPKLSFENISNTIKNSILVYNGVLFLKINKNTTIFAKDLEKIVDENKLYYIIINPYIIEYIKIYF